MVSARHCAIAANNGFYSNQTYSRLCEESDLQIEALHIFCFNSSIKYTTTKNGEQRISAHRNMYYSTTIKSTKILIPSVNISPPDFRNKGEARSNLAVLDF